MECGGLGEKLSKNYKIYEIYGKGANILEKNIIFLVYLLIGGKYF